MKISTKLSKMLIALALSSTMLVSACTELFEQQSSSDESTSSSSILDASDEQSSSSGGGDEVDDPTPPGPGVQDPYVAPAVSKNSATAEEKARSNAYYERIVNDVSQFPMTFKLDGQAYTGFSKSEFTLVSNVKTTEGNATVNVITVQHNVSGLKFEIEAKNYPDYAAYEWVTYLYNDTDHNSPIVSDLYALDTQFVGANPTLHYSLGDQEQYKPYDKLLNGELTFEPDAGRSTEDAFPYYTFDYGTGGMVLAIGWAGEWWASFDNSASSNVTTIKAKQKTLNTYIKPYETIRTPSIAIINYDGQDEDRTTNLWRRWYIDNIMYRPDESDNEKGLMDPAANINLSNTGNGMENVCVTEEGLVAAFEWLQSVGLSERFDFTWLDAGWYTGAGDSYLGSGITDWQQVGTWTWDLNRFPTMGKAITEAAKAAGIENYILWLEPERFTIIQDSLKDDGTTAKKEWIIDGQMFDLANPEAAAWMTNRILTIFEEGGFTLYREDMNVHTPESYWLLRDEQQEGENRDGISENLHIQNHFTMWDAIAKATGMPIDACASGGNRLDLDTMRYAIILHRTDNYYQDGKYQQLYSSEMYKWFPYFGGVSTSGYETSKYRYRYAMAPFYRVAAWCDFGGDPELDVVNEMLDEWESINPYMYGDYYELFSWSYSDSAWMGWEHYDESVGEGYAIFFRHATADATKTVKLKGLMEDRYYHIWFEDAGRHQYVLGKTLMEQGVEVTLPSGETSDILHISQTYVERGLTAKITRVHFDGSYGDAVQVVEDYNRFDIRFNRALRSTVFNKTTNKIEEDILDVALLKQITVGGQGLVSLVAAGSAYVNYDVENNLLQVYIKNTAVDFTKNVDVTIGADLTTYEGIALGTAVTYTYNAGMEVFSKSGETPVEYKPLVHVPYDDPETFDDPLTLTEEVLSGINYKWPWAINKTGITSWSYNAQAGNSSYGVFKLTTAEADQYAGGDQAIKVLGENMLQGTDYFLDISLMNLEPGQYMTVTMMVYCGLENMDELSYAFRNENNAEGGNLGNYVVSGKLVQGEWAEFKLSFIANPGNNGLQLMKFCCYPKKDNVGGYLIIDNIQIIANEMDREEQTGYAFEDDCEIGEVAYKYGYNLKSTDKQTFYTWDYPTENKNIYSYEDGAKYGAEGNVIVGDLKGATRITRQNDAGYFLSYLFHNMDAGKNYYLTFRVKGVMASKLGIYAMPERNYADGASVTVQGYEYTISWKNDEWTEIKVAFTAHPDADGVCCLRLSIRPDEGEVGEGKIIFDNFKLSKSLFNTDEFGTIAITYPWNSDGAVAHGDYRTWTYDVSEYRAFTWVDEGYDGRGIEGNINDVKSTVSLDGGGYFLNYYTMGLTPGKWYKLKVAYKNQLTDASFSVATEPNGPSGIIMNSHKFDATSEWKIEELVFQAGGDEDKTTWCFRFAIYPKMGTTGSGTINLDILGLEETTKPVDPDAPESSVVEGTFFEDNAAIVDNNPWNGNTGGFEYWYQGSAVTPVFVEYEKGDGHYILLDYTAGGIYNGGTLDYGITGLEKGKTYQFSLYIKGSADLVFSSIRIGKETQWASSSVDGADTSFTNITTEWQKVNYTFTANPNEDGIVLVAIEFSPRSDVESAGKLYVDCLSLVEIEKEEIEITAPEEGTFIEDAHTDYIGAAPWEISTKTEGFAFWTQNGMKKPAFGTYTEGAGSYIYLDLYTESVLTGNGQLDLYMANLVEGKEYELTFYVKGSADLVFNRIQVRKEHSYGTITLSGAELAVNNITTEWVQYSIKFIANPNADTGLCAICFDFYPNEEAMAKGYVFLDCIAINEVEVEVDDTTAPEEGTFLEDGASIVDNNPWNEPTGGFEYWSMAGVPTAKFEAYEEGEGSYIVMDFTGSGAGDGALDYYTNTLESGKEYELSFYVKRTEDLASVSLRIGKESQYVTVDTADIKLQISDMTTEWKKVTYHFVASPKDSGYSAICFGPYVSDAETVAGKIYIDCISITPVAVVETVSTAFTIDGTNGGYWENLDTTDCCTVGDAGAVESATEKNGGTFNGTAIYHAGEASNSMDVVLRLNEEVLNAITEDTVSISISVYMYGSTSQPLQFWSIDETVEFLGGESGRVTFNNEWKTITFTGSDIQTIKAQGGIYFYTQYHDVYLAVETITVFNPVA